MSAQSTPKRLRGSFARSGLVLTTGALALLLAACGGGSTPTAASTSTPSAPAARGNNTPPGAFGTAAAVTATNVEVQNPTSGQVTVNFNSSTMFTNTVTSALSDVKVGSCVTVIAASGNMQTMTAGTVAITQPTASGCTLAGGAFGFGGGARGAFGGGGGRRGGGTRAARPSGTANPNAGRIAIGSVSALESGGFTVQDVARGKQPAQTTVVVTNGATKFTATEKATAAALAVGDCVAATGPSDDTGAITAKSILISKATAQGCTLGGLGGRGGFRGNGNGGGEGAGTPSQIPGGGNG